MMAGEMAQRVKRLSHKHEDSNLDPQNPDQAIYGSTHG